MIEWILILLVHVGPMSAHDSNSLTNVPGFVSEAECLAAGQRTIELVSGTTKKARFICVRRTVR